MDKNFLAAEARWLDPDEVDAWVDDLIEEDYIKGDEDYDYFIHS